MKKFLATVSTVGILGASIIGGNAAMAADSTTVIKGDQLDMTQPTIGNFDEITLNGLAQSTNAQVGSFTVKDPRGTGDGWSVWMQATQFTDSSNGNVLPQNSLEIAAPSISEVEGSGSSDAQLITTTGGKIDNENGLVILSAGSNKGMGSYIVDANTLTLNLLPRDVKAGSYTTTVTVTFPTGP